MRGDVLTVTDPDSGDEVVLPTRWAICSHCRGDGRRALGGLALTPEFLADWDEEDRMAYATGAYDTPCEDCDGSGKVREVDEDLVPERLLEVWWEDCRIVSEMRRADLMERRWGC